LLRTAMTPFQWDFVQSHVNKSVQYFDHEDAFPSYQVVPLFRTPFVPWIITIEFEKALGSRLRQTISEKKAPCSHVYHRVVIVIMDILE
jgi:hypothetical protein